MSADKPKRAGQPVYRKPKPGLRLVKNPEAPRPPAPEPKLEAALDDMKRRRRVRWSGRAPHDDGRDAA